jgi:hypothetical protein
MSNSKSTLFLAVLLIAVGSGWLLTALGFLPAINWLWTLGLAATGLATIALFGFDKVTAVIGPFFLITSLLSVLRQAERITLNIEVPILVITAGFLLMISRLPIIPSPKWILDDSAPN